MLCPAVPQASASVRVGKGETLTELNGCHTGLKELRVETQRRRQTANARQPDPSELTRPRLLLHGCTKRTSARAGMLAAASLKQKAEGTAVLYRFQSCRIEHVFVGRWLVSDSLHIRDSQARQSKAASLHQNRVEV